MEIENTHVFVLNPRNGKQKTSSWIWDGGLFSVAMHIQRGPDRKGEAIVNYTGRKVGKQTDW